MTSAEDALAATEPLAAHSPTAASSLKHGSLLFFLATLSGNSAYFFTVLILARILGPADRGTVAFVIVSALIVPRIANLGHMNATELLAAQQPERRSTLLSNAFSFALTSGVIAAAAFCAALAAAGGVRPAGIHFWALVSIALAAVALEVQEECFSFLYGCARFRQGAAVRGLGPWAYLLLLLAIWGTIGIDVTDAALAWATGQTLIAIGLAVYAVQVSGLGRVDLALLRRNLAFGVRAWPGSLAHFLNFRIDQLLMGFLATEASLGLYAVAVNASEVLLYLPNAIALVLTPVIARAVVRDRVTTSLRAFRLSFMLTFIGVVIAAGTGPVLVPFVFGHQYRASVIPFLLLAPGALGFAAMTIFTSALLASSAPGRSSVGPLIAFAVGVTLDLALIPPFDARGAAVAASLAFLAGGLGAGMAYRREHEFDGLLLMPTRRDARDLVKLARETAQNLLVSLRGIVPSAPRRREISRRRPRRARQASDLALKFRGYYAAKQWWQRAQTTTARRHAESFSWSGVRLLGYHRLAEEYDELAIRPDRFRGHMEALLSAPVVPVDINSAVSLVRSEATGRYVCVTFDDGYYDNLEVAVPILEELGIPASIFVVSAVIDRRARLPWYGRQPPLLSWDEIRDIDQRALFSVGAHTRTHPILTSLDADQAMNEIAGSKSDIEEILGREVTEFCYPAGYFGPREVDLVARAGFRAGISCEPGVNDAPQLLGALRRTMVARRDTRADFVAKIAGFCDAPSYLRLRPVRGRLES